MPEPATQASPQPRAAPAGIAPHDMAGTQQATAPLPLGQPALTPLGEDQGHPRPLWLHRIAILVSEDGDAAARSAAQAPDFQLEVFTDGAEMLLMCGSHPPTCALIDSRVTDIALPSAVKALVKHSATPVFVGVWDDDESKQIAVEALHAGARGLVAMPASEPDLRTALRSSGGRGNAGFTKIELGSLTVFQESREVWIRGVSLRLAEIEFGLLWWLLRSFPQPVPLNELAQGGGEFPPCKGAALKARASRLRRKLEAAVPGAGVAVTSVPGVGYVAREFY